MTVKTDRENDGGFDVTCVIGHVTPEQDENGYPSPFHAAMALIADHDSDGTYTFPSASGGTVYIDVYHKGNKK